MRNVAFGAFLHYDEDIGKKDLSRLDCGFI